MNSSDSNPDGVFAIFAGLGVFAIAAIVVWVGLALISVVVAPDGRLWTCFWLTLLLFGPLGVLAAAVASPRDPEMLVPEPAAGRTRFTCARCAAKTDLVEKDENPSCWRCGDANLVAADR